MYWALGNFSPTSDIDNSIAFSENGGFDNDMLIMKLVTDNAISRTIIVLRNARKHKLLD